MFACAKCARKIHVEGYHAIAVARLKELGWRPVKRSFICPECQS